MDDGRVEAELTDQCDSRLFNGIAHAILKKFKGQVAERLDGLDERYWDIAIGNRTITLAQHYTGISLYSENQEANDLAREVASYLEEIDPAPMWREVFLLKNFFRINRSHRIHAPAD